MDHTPFSHDANVDRVINNDHAWRNETGYRTTSGCPCWDRSMYPCIPKHSGWGYDANFWCLFGFFLCQKVDKQVVPTDELAPVHANEHDHPHKRLHMHVHENEKESLRKQPDEEHHSETKQSDHIDEGTKPDAKHEGKE